MQQIENEMISKEYFMQIFTVFRVEKSRFAQDENGIFCNLYAISGSFYKPLEQLFKEFLAVFDV